MHDNVDEDPTMATRFGLHGIPAFIVFRGGRKVGRITEWPGAQAFVLAIENQIAAAEAL
jgi:thioredoxin-like negative regulator of GroEL